MRAFLIASVCGVCLAAVVVFQQQPSKAESMDEPAAKTTAARDFVIEPYLQYTTRTSVTIMCETPTPTTCVIDYGHDVPGTVQIKSAAEATIHEITLEGLTPKSAYFYKVTCTDGSRSFCSKALSFFTAPDADDAWSFAVIGDTQKNPTITGQVASENLEPSPELRHPLRRRGGQRSGQEGVGPTNSSARAELFGRVPLYPCIGNHEKNHANYYQYFSLPKPEYYYSFTYGNAEFFSIDTNKKVGPGSEQYEWLDKALGASKATWKFCYHHHPAYTSDSDDYGNTFER